MRCQRVRGSILSATAALVAAVVIAACTAQPDGVQPKAVVLSEEWSAIPVSQADLALPKDLPIAVSSLHRRRAPETGIEDLYFFDDTQGVEGYILTSRIPDGSFPEETMLEMRQARLFHYYVRQQPETFQHQLEISKVSFFRKSHLHFVGHYTAAPSGNGQEQCFFARLGTLLDEDKIGRLPPAAIDTVVKGALCGTRIDEKGLVAALQNISLPTR